MSEPNRKDSYKLLKDLGMLSMIPMVLVSGPLAGFLLGRLINLKFKTGQGLIIFLVLLGFVAGARQAYQIIKKVSSEH